MAILKLMRLLIGSQWSWRRAETDGSARSLRTILDYLGLQTPTIKQPGI